MQPTVPGEELKARIVGPSDKTKEIPHQNNNLNEGFEY
jgi:hypothetical protein